jgi:hypothetical protein
MARSAYSAQQEFAPRRLPKLRYVFLRILAGVVVSVAVLFFLDYAVFRIKSARNEGFGTVTVHPYYAVPQKSHKVEFLTAEPEDDACVHALFPHAGDLPCWYLERNKNRRIDM